MVANAGNPSTWKAETRGSQVQGQPQLLSKALCNIVRSSFKPGVVAHACHPSTWEAETGGLQVHGQPQLLSKALRNLVRPCFKIKNKK